MVGVLIVFKTWNPDARWAVKQVLTALCVMLARAIDRSKTGGRHGATCSQFVYELYDEAGFRLNIMHRDRAMASAGMNLLQETRERLEAGDIDEVEENSAATLDKFAAAGGKSFDLEQMCCALLAVIEGTDSKNAMEPEESDEKEDVFEEVVRFASLVLAVDSTGTVFERDNGIMDWGKRALEHLLENYSGFISPGQLYSDCPDLAHEVTVIKP